MTKYEKELQTGTPEYEKAVAPADRAEKRDANERDAEQVRRDEHDDDKKDRA
jgi:hypothetical protein